MPAARAAYKDDAIPHFTTNPIIERVQSQWLFTPSELQRAPSIVDGMKAELERSNRSKGVNFITQVGMLLKLPQLTLATASVYLHRFFMRHSMVDLPNRPGLHHYAVAATALFLATKVEENCRKMKELVVACCRVAQKQPNLIVDEQNKEYWKWRDTILHNEDLLLEALCFDLQLEQPYRILFEFLCYYDVQHDKNLRNVSWAYINDANLTPMCLLFPTRLIAGSALYAAAKFTGVTFPDDEQGRPWWDTLGLDIVDITRAVNFMAEVYENSTLPRQGQKEVYRKAGEEGPDTTRSANSPGTAQSPSQSVGAESQGMKRDREEDNSWIGNGENGATSDTHSQRPQSAQPQQDRDERAPSPKRQRRESSASDRSQSQQMSTEQPAPQARPRHDSTSQEVDDVQSRIDAIINATTIGPGPPNSHPHPPLSRRTSSRQQQWPGPPLRRRSSSISNRQRPPSRQDSYVGEQRRSSPGTRPSYEDERRPESEFRRRPSYDGPEPEYNRRPSYDRGFIPKRESFTQSGVANGHNPDDGGSEEGEL